MNSLQQLERIRRLNDQRSANATHALRRLDCEIEALAAQITDCNLALRTHAETVARMRGETVPLLDRAAFFERKRREASLLAKQAAERRAGEGLQDELTALHEKSQILQQGISLLKSKARKWQKAERHFRRQRNAREMRNEQQAIEESALCKQLIPLH